MKRLFPLLAILLINASFVRTVAKAEDLATAVSDGKVSVTFRGTGGSSGDAIEATVVTTPKAGGDLVLTMAPGTRLQSGNSGAQNMVIAGVRGRVIDKSSYTPGSEILVSNTPTTYVFDAYCTDFDKDNPSTGTKFTLGKVDPVLACILSEANSTIVKQAAVWIYTDKASYRHVNQKFTVSQSDWDAAMAIVNKCSAKNPGEPLETVLIPGGQIIHLDHPLHNGDTFAAMGGNNGVSIVGGTEVHAKNSLDEIDDAARNGDMENVNALLKSNPDLVFSKDTSSGRTALYEAVLGGHKDVAALLLANKAEVDAKDNYGETPLQAASENGFKEVAELLLANKAEVNARDIHGATSLHYAAFSGHKDVTELLLANKADINAKDNLGKTPLHMAAAQGHKAVAELLLANKADVNAEDNAGSTPLAYAIVGDHKDVMELLQINHAYFTVKESNAGDGEIHAAAEKGDLDKVKALLKDNPNLASSKGHDDRTPLHYAAYKGNRDMAAFLLASKAEVNAKMQSGETPLLTAAFYGHKDVAELLLANNADVNVRNKNDFTPLHAAAQGGYKELAELLLMNKAEVNAKNKDGWTPLHEAAKNDHKDVAELLLANNADVNAKTNDGQTPLHYASATGHNDVAELLRQHGGQE
jgi:ankyrin repeat protein